MIWLDLWISCRHFKWKWVFKIQWKWLTTNVTSLADTFWMKESHFTSPRDFNQELTTLNYKSHFSLQWLPFLLLLLSSLYFFITFLWLSQKSIYTDKSEWWWDLRYRNTGLAVDWFFSGLNDLMKEQIPSIVEVIYLSGENLRIHLIVITFPSPGTPRGLQERHFNGISLATNPTPFVLQKFPLVLQYKM